MAPAKSSKTTTKSTKRTGRKKGPPPGAGKQARKAPKPRNTGGNTGGKTSGKASPKKEREKEEKKAAEPSPRRRPRRSAEETRAEILDAAQRRLVEGGADAIRLQEIARDVGISHPAVLHHFGSREGLIEALELRITGALAEEVGRLLLAGEGALDRASRAGLIESVARAMSERGLARTVAWWALRDTRPAETNDQPRLIVSRVVELVRARLAEEADGPGRRVPTREEIAFSIRLTVLAMFGDALVGGALGQAPPEECEAETRRFHEWLAELIAVHLALERPRLEDEAGDT